MSNVIYSESMLRSMEKIKALRESKSQDKCLKCRAILASGSLCAACFRALPWLTQDILLRKWKRESA